jgi:hypothetical protein
MRTVVVVVLLSLTAACNADLVMPDDVLPGDIAGPNANDWWMGMPPEAPGDLVLDARLTRYDGAFASFDTIDVCRGACRHIAYGGNGLLALDNQNEGIQLVDKSGAVVTLLTFPLDEAEQAGPWLLAARGDTLVAASGVRVFQRDGESWNELASLDASAFSIDVEPNGIIVARRSIGEALLPAALVGDEWIAHDDDIDDGALVAFEPDGSFASSQSIAPPAADAFVPLRMFARGLLAARLVGTTLDAVIVDASGAVTTWASLGSAESINAASFRATVFDDGTVGVLYPGAPRDEGVGPKTVLHVNAAP